MTPERIAELKAIAANGMVALSSVYIELLAEVERLTAALAEARKQFADYCEWVANEHGVGG